MRILGRECKKILDIRLLAVLAVFSYLFYLTFMRLAAYPAGGQNTNSPYDIPFMAQLTKELAPEISLSELPKLEAKKEDLKKELYEAAASSQILQAAGITDIDEMDKIYGQLLKKESLTDEERNVYREIERIYFSDENTAEIHFGLQCIDNVLEFLGTAYGADKADAERFAKRRYGGASEAFKEAIAKRRTKNTVSLLPLGLFFILQEDMRRMAVLFIISFFVLILHYQIRERLRGVTPLYASTHTGRKIFRKQFAAGLLSCAAAGAVQIFAYVSIFAGKGLGVFWKCPAWSYCSNNYWSDRLSFGVYMAVYLLLVWIFALAGTAAAYCIGRTAANYIAGIAFSLPAGCVICFAGMRLFQGLFQMRETDVFGLWELGVLGVWVLLAAAVIGVRMRRDGKCDI